MKNIFIVLFVAWLLNSCSTRNYMQAYFYPHAVTDFPCEASEYHIKERITIMNSVCDGSSSGADTTMELYDKKGNLISVYYYNHGNTETPQIRWNYTYNKKGFLIADSSFGNNRSRFTTSYRYDVFSKRISLATKSVQGDTVTNSSINFNRHKIYSRIDLDKKGDTVTYYLRQGNVETSTWYRYKNNKDDSLLLLAKDVVVTDEVSGKKMTWHYSPSGFEHECPYMEQSFDKSGKLISETVYAENGAIYYSAKNSYAENGLLQQSILSSYNKDGHLSARNTDKYFYDETKRISRIEHYDEKSNIPVTTDAYTYNEKGLVIRVQTTGAEAIHNYCIAFSYTYY